MKKRILDKLGTILNTVGSLGVGYYVGKFGLFVGTPLPSLTQMEQIQLGGCLIIISLGLVIRWHDIFRIKNNEDSLNAQIGIVKNDLKEKENRLHDIKLIIDASLERIVLGAVPDAVEDYLDERDRTSSPSVPIPTDSIENNN